MRSNFILSNTESEKRRVWQKRFLVFTVLASLVLFTLPLVKDYTAKWHGLRAAARLTVFLSSIKTQAILKGTPLEVRFQLPDILAVSEVSSCGPNSKITKLWENHLSEFASGVQFVPTQWLRAQTSITEPILWRFCYDPLFGSSLVADGLVRGAIFVAHQKHIQAADTEQIIPIYVEGSSGDLHFD